MKTRTMMTIFAAIFVAAIGIMLSVQTDSDGFGDSEYEYSIDSGGLTVTITRYNGIDDIVSIPDTVTYEDITRPPN